MPRLKWLRLLLFSAVAVSAADGPVDPSALLVRIRGAIAKHLAELPNYTCHQLIERSVRPAESRRYEPLDTVRLDVAYVGGRELFGWPGAGKFEEKGIDELIGGRAAIGNGFFAGHLRALFMTGAATFTYSGESERNGRKCLRYAYRVPRAKSEFVFRDASKAAIVGYGGSFLVDPETLDLLRLEIQVDEVPPGLVTKAANDALEYGRVRIGDRDFLLPESAEMILVDVKGNENRNITRLSGCRQYMGESVLKFEDAPAAETSAPVKESVAVALPPWLQIETVLGTRLEGAIAIGDAVSATVAREVKKDGKVLVPKGAAISGHVTRVEKRRTRGFEYFVIGIAFSSFEGGGHRGEFLASIERAGSFGNTYHAPLSHGVPGPLSIWSSILRDFPGWRPGEGIIYVKGESLRLPAGLAMNLMVVPPDEGMR